MTTNAIIAVLLDNLGNIDLSRAEKRRIVHRNHETIFTDRALDEAFENVRALAHQHNGLREAMPHNAELYASQFSDGVRKQAEAIQSAIETQP